MVSLEEKILGYRADNYCSSSDGEEEEKEAPCPRADSGKLPQPRPAGTSANTGPKGVLEDWKEYERLKRAEMIERKGKLLQEVARRSMFCTMNDDTDEKEKSNSDEELERLFSSDDEFILEFAKKKMDELRAKYSQKPGADYGSVRELTTKQEMLTAIDFESLKTTVFVHIYEQDARGCSAMDEAFRDLATEYPHICFCRARAATVGMSQHFRRNGLPTLQVYKCKELVLNLVRLTDYLGDDFFAGDLERVLAEYSVLTR